MTQSNTWQTASCLARDELHRPHRRRLLAKVLLPAGLQLVPRTKTSCLELLRGQVCGQAGEATVGGVVPQKHRTSSEMGARSESLARLGVVPHKQKKQLPRLACSVRTPSARLCPRQRRALACALHSAQHNIIRSRSTPASSPA